MKKRDKIVIFFFVRVATLECEFENPVIQERAKKRLFSLSKRHKNNRKINLKYTKKMKLTSTYVLFLFPPYFLRSLDDDSCFLLLLVESDGRLLLFCCWLDRFLVFFWEFKQTSPVVQRNSRKRRVQQHTIKESRNPTIIFFELFSNGMKTPEFKIIITFFFECFSYFSSRRFFLFYSHTK